MIALQSSFCQFCKLELTFDQEIELGYHFSCNADMQSFKAFLDQSIPDFDFADFSSFYATFDFSNLSNLDKYSQHVILLSEYLSFKKISLLDRLVIITHFITLGGF